MLNAGYILHPFSSSQLAMGINQPELKISQLNNGISQLVMGINPFTSRILAHLYYCHTLL